MVLTDSKVRQAPQPRRTCWSAGTSGTKWRRGSSRFPDTPAEVLGKLVQVDGSGSTLDSDLVDGLNGVQFMRTDTDTGTTGNVEVAGKMASAQVITTYGDIQAARGQVALNTLGNIKMTDNDIIGVQGFFNDPGPDGRIEWQGTGARIYVAPLITAIQTECSECRTRLKASS